MILVTCTFFTQVLVTTALYENIQSLMFIAALNRDWVI